MTGTASLLLGVRLSPFTRGLAVIKEKVRAIGKETWCSSPPWAMD